MKTLLLSGLAVAVAAALTGQARAETAAPAPAPVLTSSPAVAPLSLVLKVGKVSAFPIDAMPTAVSQRLGDDKVTGAFGFLCGLQPRLAGGGSLDAFGSDPNGRFLGGKLSYAF